MTFSLCPQSFVKIGLTVNITSDWDDMRYSRLQVLNNSSVSAFLSGRYLLFSCKII